MVIMNRFIYWWIILEWTILLIWLKYFRSPSWRAKEVAAIRPRSKWLTSHRRTFSLFATHSSILWIILFIGSATRTPIKSLSSRLRLRSMRKKGVRVLGWLGTRFNGFIMLFGALWGRQTQSSLHHWLNQLIQSSSLLSCASTPPRLCELPWRWQTGLGYQWCSLVLRYDQTFTFYIFANSKTGRLFGEGISATASLSDIQKFTRVE